MAFGFPAYHTESYSPGESGSDLRDAVKEVLTAISWAVKQESSDTIVASSSVNIWSWGEEIIIRFLANNSLSVTSKCAFALQCFDWGKNKRNINRFMTELGKHV